MKTGSLQSIYDSSQSTGEDNSLTSTIYSSNSKHVLVRHTVSDIKTTKTHIVDGSLTTPNQSFGRKCQHTFKMYSKYSINTSIEEQDFGIPYSNIEDAIEALGEILEMPIKHNFITKVKYFQKGNELVPYTAFYQYACKLFDRKPEELDSVSPGSSKNVDDRNNDRLNSTFNKTSVLVRVQRPVMLSQESLTQDGFAIPITDPNASVVTLKGTVIPSTYLKDAIVESYRRHHHASSVDELKTSGSGEYVNKLLNFYINIQYVLVTFIFIAYL